MKTMQPRLRKQPGLFCLHLVTADAAGGQQGEEFIEGKSEKRDEQRLDDFRDNRLLSREEASSGIGGRKIWPARNNGLLGSRIPDSDMLAICRVSRSDPEAHP